MTTTTVKPSKKLIAIPTRTRRWRSLNINLFVYGVLVVAVFLGVIQAFQLAGVWSVSGKMTAGGDKIAATGADPNEIKGWMLIEDVLTAYNVPKADFYQKFNIPADLPTSAALKDIEKNASGFSVSALRTWLAQRQGQ